MESFMQKYKIKKSVVGYIFLDIDILSYPMVNWKKHM
jgi:hypothetical protein